MIRRIDATKEGATTLAGGSKKDEGIVVGNTKTTGFEPVPVNIRGSNYKGDTADKTTKPQQLRNTDELNITYHTHQTITKSYICCM